MLLMHSVVNKYKQHKTIRGGQLYTNKAGIDNQLYSLLNFLFSLQYKKPTATKLCAHITKHERARILRNHHEEATRQRKSSSTVQQIFLRLLQYKLCEMDLCKGIWQVPYQELALRQLM